MRFAHADRERPDQPLAARAREAGPSRRRQWRRARPDRLQSRQSLELFARQLGDFLGYAAEVQAVDTVGVTPTAYVEAYRVTPQVVDRPDEVGGSLDREAALGNAPDPARDAGMFKVPQVIG